MAEPITLDELLAELDRLGLPADKGADGLTSHEWGEQWRTPHGKTAAQIKRFVKAGIMVPGRAHRQAMDGMFRPVPVYRVAKGKKR